MRHPNQGIQEEAAFALKSYCEAYFSDEGDLAADRIFILREIGDLLEPSMHDANIAVTKGFNMALGVLSKRLLQEMSRQLVKTLATNCIAYGKESDDAETRKQAVKSLVAVVNTLGLDWISPELLKVAIETLFSALKDYQLDRRGDVGSWVREETMLALTSLITTLVQQG